MIEKMNAWLDEHIEEMIETLQGFARIPSVSRADLGEGNAPFGPDCRKMLDYALACADEMGFATGDCDGYMGSATLGDAGNAIGIISHLDVVPIAKGWTYPPFGATREGDFLFGRGVSDNKSAGVMALYLMRMLRELNIPMKHGVTALFGLSEETGMQDLAYYRDHAAVQPVISLVPDGAFPVCQAQKGSLNATVSIDAGAQLSALYAGEAVNIVPPEASVHVALSEEQVCGALAGMDCVAVEPDEAGCTLVARGVAAHAAHPEGGVNAIHLLAEALCRLPLSDEVSCRAAQAICRITEGYYGECVNIAAEDAISGKTTLNIGLARAQDGRLILKADARLSIVSRPADMVAAFCAAAGEMGFQVEEADSTAPFHLPDDHPALTALMSAYREITGRDDRPYAMGGGTYSRVLPTAITFGAGMTYGRERPGHLPAGHGDAHQNDEYLHIPSWLNTAKIYAASLLKLDAAVD